MRYSTLRKFSLASWTVTCAATIPSQFWVAYLRLPGMLIYTCPSGMGFEYRGSLLFRGTYVPVQPTIPFEFFAGPSFYTANVSDPGLFLPWWLLLTVLTVFGVVLWHRTRARGRLPGFPVAAA